MSHSFRVGDRVRLTPTYTGPCWSQLEGKVGTVTECYGPDAGVVAVFQGTPRAKGEYAFYSAEVQLEAVYAPDAQEALRADWLTAELPVATALSQLASCYCDDPRHPTFTTTTTLEDWLEAIPELREAIEA